jgi:tetratricopeptide (TPR) repeat protein
MDLDNIRAALRHSAADPDPTNELKLGSSIWRYWWVRGLLAEGRAVSEGALARRGVVTTSEGARTLRAAASLAWTMGDFDAAFDAARRGVAVAEAVGDVTEQLSGFNVLGAITRSRDELEAAEGFYQQAIDLATSVGNAELVSMYRGNLGALYAETGRLDQARDVLHAVLAYHAPNPPSDHSAVVHLNLGQVELDAGDLAASEAHFLEALRGMQSVGFKGRIANAMQGLAAVEARTGRGEAAARRLGAAAALIGETGWAAGDSPLEQAAVAAARAALGEGTFERLFNEGLAGD